jgi:hypothetical protein
LPYLFPRVTASTPRNHPLCTTFEKKKKKPMATAEQTDEPPPARLVGGNLNGITHHDHQQPRGRLRPQVGLNFDPDIDPAPYPKFFNLATRVLLLALESAAVIYLIWLSARPEAWKPVESQQGDNKAGFVLAVITVRSSPCSYLCRCWKSMGNNLFAETTN